MALAGLMSLMSGGLLLAVGGTATAGPGSVPCVSSEAWTEPSGWVLESPGEGWRLVATRVVVDQGAYDEVVEDAYWQRYSWTGGPQAPGNDPATVVPPDPRWQANVKGDPHGVGVEGPYWRSNGTSGNSDWFYLDWVDEVVKHHDAVTHEESRYAYDHLAVVCEPTTPPTETPNTQPPDVLPATGTATPETEEPSQDPTAMPADEQVDDSETPEVLPATAAQPPKPQAQVPTAVDAGFAGQPITEPWGAALAAGGLVLLVASGTAVVRASKV